ncbi:MULTISPECIES: cell division protein FtsQ/DivIB [Trichocoleus]|uniref:FtsQ-type POTRA domain-containing protein n=1 Tax=Trichocoleus desertorum GB2-A4 TaxID=2933944 RepID=A0ABV0J2I7_9CYAN|nr:FtsQ-type POTRA domain-containing protein [Trichocoleus sp. FACHB-46]MBD1860592.1 FtsQ-type POTRA domain-containing protein [Trichocoleus sp. FACHB-46]
MTSISAVSQNELAQRRQKLRQERRLKALQTSWRTIAVSGLAGGLAWVITLPGWVIRQPEQVAIAGNRFLSSQAIQSLLPMAYPQSLLQLEPQAIAAQLESKAPIEDATVARQLFPPRLIVQVKERYPVAMISDLPNAEAVKDKETKPAIGLSNVGFLDANGVWIPIESYTSFDQSFQLPTLKIVGYQEQKRSQWAELYQSVSQSPVKVTEIDWRDPSNIVLKTELGIFHFGSYSSRFAEQIQAMDQLRKLSDKLNPKQVAYVDLQNPDAPSIQMQKANNSVKSNTDSTD